MSAEMERLSQELAALINQWLARPGDDVPSLADVIGVLELTKMDFHRQMTEDDE